jgi:hypothetical protein
MKCPPPEGSYFESLNAMFTGGFFFSEMIRLWGLLLSQWINPLTESQSIIEWTIGRWWKLWKVGLTRGSGSLGCPWRVYRVSSLFPLSLSFPASVRWPALLSHTPSISLHAQIGGTKWLWNKLLKPWAQIYLSSFNNFFSSDETLTNTNSIKQRSDKGPFVLQLDHFGSLITWWTSRQAARWQHAYCWMYPGRHNSDPIWRVTVELERRETMRPHDQ